MFSAILFDMDGTLIDSEVLWKETERDFFHDLLPHFDSELLPHFVGSSLYDVIDMIQERHPDFPLSREEFLKTRRAFAVEHIYHHTTLYPGVLSFLSFAKSKYKTALGTSACEEWVNATLDRHQISPYFDHIVSVDHLSKKRAKPHPDIFLYCATKLNVAPKNCLVIEDSDKGISAGKRAGMTVFAFRNAHNTDRDFSEADEVFSNFGELQKRMQE